MTNTLLRRFAALTAFFALAGSAAGQATAYGDHTTGSITSAGQTKVYFFQGNAGDTLLVSFRSDFIGWPTNQYMHELEVRDGTTPIGNLIDGVGTMTTTLPTTGFYTIHVSARNNQWTGGYAFQMNRVNDPVNADVQPVGWTIEEDIQESAEFHMFTIHGEAGKTTDLQFTSQFTGWPSNTYNHFCELLAPDGTQIASVLGNGSSGNFTFPATDVYTLYVRARDHNRLGWFSARLDCVSWPTCDATARTGNYATGTPGTNGVPTLTASAAPQLGTTVGIQIGNCAGQATTGLLLAGVDRNWDYLSAYDARLLVDTPMVIPLAFSSGADATVNFSLPSASAPGAFVLTGFAIAAQSVVMDSAATGGYAFSRGLMLKIGY